MVPQLTTGRAHQVVVVEVIRIGGVVEPRVVHVHQRIDRETVIAGRRQVVHLRRERIVAGVEQRRGQPILHHTLGGKFEPRFALKRLMMPERRLMVLATVERVVVVMVMMVVTPTGHDLDRLDVAHLIVQQQALPLHQLFLLLQCVLLLEPTPPPQKRPVVEHVVRVGIQRPVAALARFLVVPRHLHEALVQAEVVAYRVLPALLVVPIVREPVHDVLVDTVQRDLLISRVLDGHRDEGDVGVRGFHHLLVLVRSGQCVGRAGVRVPRVLIVRVVVSRRHRRPVRCVAGLRVPIMALVRREQVASECYHHHRKVFA
uniref:Uncharacterized protein n=1 Tax=Anopheles farauti TaxID=69004 RepID=A0A182Q5E9_9DIPT